MTENYDDVCSLCGRKVDVKGALYYCCEECWKTERYNCCNRAPKQPEETNQGN